MGRPITQDDLDDFGNIAPQNRDVFIVTILVSGWYFVMLPIMMVYLNPLLIMGTIGIIFVTLMLMTTVYINKLHKFAKIGCRFVNLASNVLYNIVFMQYLKQLGYNSNVSTVLMIAFSFFFRIIHNYIFDKFDFLVRRIDYSVKYRLSLENKDDDNIEINSEDYDSDNNDDNEDKLN